MTSRALLVLLAACRGATGPLPSIEVDTALPGASAETIANAVTTPLERQLGQMHELEIMTSTSALGRSQIHLGFARGTDLETAAKSVRAALDAAMTLLPRTLPTSPTYAKIGVRVARFWSTGDTFIQAHRLEQLAGVGRVDVCGEPREDRWLAVDPAALAHNGIAISEVRDAIVAANVASTARRPVSRVELGDQVLAVRPSRTGELLEAPIAIRNGSTIRVGEVAHERAALPPACRASDATGAHVAIDVVAQPGVDPADLRDRIAALAKRPELRGLHEVPPLPDEHELLVALDPSSSPVELGAALRSIGGDFVVEQRDDDALVRVAIAGDATAVAAELRKLPSVTGAGAPTSIVELSGDDPAVLASATKVIAARFAARGALIATEGLREIPSLDLTLDRDTAARLGVAATELDLTLALRGGMLISTIFTANTAIHVFLIAEPGPLYLRAATGELVPLDAIARVEQHAVPAVVLHAGQFPAVRLYTTNAEVGDVPVGIQATVAPYR